MHIGKQNNLNTKLKRPYFMCVLPAKTKFMVKARWDVSNLSLGSAKEYHQINIPKLHDLCTYTFIHMHNKTYSMDKMHSYMRTCHRFCMLIWVLILILTLTFHMAAIKLVFIFFKHLMIFWSLIGHKFDYTVQYIAREF